MWARKPKEARHDRVQSVAFADQNLSELAESIRGPDGVARFVLPSDGVQNGASDAVAIVDVSTATVVDALSYEGSIGSVELDGLPGPIELASATVHAASESDDGSGSLARVPDERLHFLLG